MIRQIWCIVKYEIDGSMWVTLNACVRSNDTVKVTGSVDSKGCIPDEVITYV
jgi:hypothetical protein